MNTQTSTEKRRTILTMQEWIDLELTDKERAVVIGTPENPIIRPGTKNLIQAKEKSFKTTFTMRLLAGLSCGQTVFPELPVPTARKILYLHGELSVPEIKDRTIKASSGLQRPFDGLHQGKLLAANLATDEGQQAIREAVEEVRPNDLVLDPWQSFIAGLEENSGQHVSNACKFCDLLIDKYDLTLWLPIHLGKDHTRGARGHSYIGGWRDTLIELQKEGNSGLKVKIEPRWSKAPEPFHLRFVDGTLASGGVPLFRGQTEEIRLFVEKQGGKADRRDLATYLGKEDATDAFRKALERAEEAGAVLSEGNSVILKKNSNWDIGLLQ